MKEGKSARFELELSHDNVPVVWYRNEVKLHVGRTVLMHVEGKRHTLEMRTLSLDDTCQIKAEAKGSFSLAKLTVIGNQRPVSLCASCSITLTPQVLQVLLVFRSSRSSRSFRSFRSSRSSWSSRSSRSPRSLGLTVEEDCWSLFPFVSF